MRPVTALARNELRVLRREADAIVLLLALPLVLIPALRGTVTASLATAHPGVDGVQFTVPGQAVMFGFFVVTFIGFSVFREHGWRTWERLLASRATTWSIVAGKTLPWFMISLLQTAVLFGVGVAVFDLEVPGRAVPGIVAVALLYGAFLVAMALLLAGLLPSIVHVQSAANLGAIVLATAGGALVPTDVLPAWLRAVGPFTPTHWVMEVYRTLLIEGEGTEEALQALGILAAMTAAVAVAAMLVFDSRRAKEFHI